MSHGWYTCDKCQTHYHESEHPSGLGECPQCEKPVMGWAAAKHVKALRELTRTNTPDGDVCLMGLRETSILCKETKNWYEAERIVKERYPRAKKYADRTEATIAAAEAQEMVWL